MSSKGEIGIGILGAASIARKNVKAIGKNHKGLGKLVSAARLPNSVDMVDTQCRMRTSAVITSATRLSAVIVAVGSRTLSKAEAFIKEMDLSAKAYGR